MRVQEQIDEFLRGSPHAVVGASRDQSKFGNRVLRAYMRTNRDVFPVNPNVVEIEGLTAYPNLASLPEAVHGISVVAPPSVTELVVQQAGELGVRNIWMQPGSENDTALQLAKGFRMNVIAGGPCILVVLAC